MKIIHAMLFLFISFLSDAQVGFNLEHVKNKDAAVVYTGIVNTFSISLPEGIAIKNIRASAGNLQMMDDRTFILYVQEVQQAPVELQYTLIKNGMMTTETYPVKYSVKALPDYFQLRVGDHTESGRVSLNEIRKNHQIRFNDADFNGDLKNIFIRFDLMLIRSSGKPVQMKNVSSNKSTDMKAFTQKILSLRKGDKLLFQNIKAVLDSGTSRDMNDLTLEIQ